jgi:hypothetical protein
VERDLQVHSEDVDRLRAELAFVVEFFRAMGYGRCDVFFGWAWTTDQGDSDLLMKGANIPLVDLDAEVRRAENAGLGNFGQDDVWVSFEGLPVKVQFCHHSGIHLSYTEPDDITERFFTRWQAGGLNPVENEKTEDPLKWRRVRGANA